MLSATPQASCSDLDSISPLTLSRTLTLRVNCVTLSPVSVYRRGKTWWYSFRFRGRRYRRSTGFTNRQRALQVEASVKIKLLESEHRLPGLKRSRPSRNSRRSFWNTSSATRRGRPSSFSAPMLDISGVISRGGAWTKSPRPWSRSSSGGCLGAKDRTPATTASSALPR